MNEKSNNPLNIVELSKQYKDVHALKSISLSLKPGEIFGLLGPNGAGKTTLISILTSLLTPTTGTAVIFGQDIQKNSLKARRLVGVVPQEIVSHGYFTVNQVLNFHSGYYGISDNRDQIEYLLEKMALKEHKHKLVAQLSGGMKRRLLIAKALVHSPPLLLLDEPTAGVDVELRNSLWEFVRDLNQKGVTILLTTHYLQEAEELCNRIGVLDEGKLIALDNTQDMIHKLTYRQIKLTLDRPWQNNNASPQVTVDGNIVKAKLSSNEITGEAIKRLAIPIDWIQDISITEGSLEDAFVRLLHQNNGHSRT